MSSKKKAGRPTKYKEEYNHQTYIICKECGLVDTTLAKVFKTTKTTINSWKKKYPEFLASIKKGKAEFDDGLVENALLKSAQGFEKDSKYYPPVPTSIIFWLKNRQPDKWRDKREIEGTLTLEDAITQLED